MDPVLALLDRPGGRGLIARAMELRLRARGHRVRVRYLPDKGYWLFRWPGVAAPMLEPIATPPEEFERVHGDVFFQQYTPEPGDVIVDLGAGMGNELDMMCRLVGPEGAVYAIEADPATFRCLDDRRTLNGLGNATTVNVAIAETSGEVFISDVGHHLGHWLVADGRGRRVPATTLDAFVAEHGIGRIDLIKVNIEGAEARAFAGMRESIGLVRNVAVSCHDFIGLPTEAFIREFLGAHGFAFSERRPEDRRDWARSWIYATRRP
jgi:FkbM family methyltransferase